MSSLVDVWGSSFSVSPAQQPSVTSTTSQIRGAGYQQTRQHSDREERLETIIQALQAQITQCRNEMVRMQQSAAVANTNVSGSTKKWGLSVTELVMIVIALVFIVLVLFLIGVLKQLVR